MYQLGLGTSDSIATYILTSCGYCQVVGYVFSTSHDSPPVQQALTPLRQLLATAKITMPLFHLWGYRAMLIIVVVHSHHSWV